MKASKGGDGSEGVKGAKGKREQRGNEQSKGTSALGFRVSTICDHKNFDYHILWSGVPPTCKSVGGEGE